MSLETWNNFWGKQKTITIDQNNKVVHASHGFPNWEGPGQQLDTNQIKQLQSRGYKFFQTKGEK